MDEEQCIKAYVKLVEQPLASPRDANRILSQSLELLDESFVPMWEWVAAQLLYKF